VRRLIIFIFVISISFSLFAQDEEPEEETLTEADAENTARENSDFWISLGGDISMYSYMGFAYGGSFSLGFGTGSSLGLKVTWYFNEEGIDTLELNFIIRFYLLGSNAYSGPFLQFMGGPALHNRSGHFTFPSNTGIVSAGLSFGWRFLFADRWFIEPTIRGGYPYLAGATVAAGIRF